MDVDHTSKESSSNTRNANDSENASSGAPRKLSIDLLKIVHAARQTYGLRTNDYARYHAHAARRVATLHSATKTLNKPSSKKTAASAAAAKGKKANSSNSAYKSANYVSTTSQVTAESVLKDERLLELLVWETERAWSEGMKQREEIASLERSNTAQALAPKRHRALKRFQRASQHAQKLSDIARVLYKSPNAPFTAAAAFQIEIYRHYMDGTLGFVKATSPGGSSSQATASSTPTSAALLSLGSAYVLLKSYGQATAHATEEAIAFELLDELEPLIRFCAYKTGSSRDRLPAQLARDAGKDALSLLEDDQHYPNLITKLAKEESASHKKKDGKSAIVNHLSWRDIDLPIRSAELGEILGRVNTAVADIASKTHSKTRDHAAGISTYERSLAALIEAEDRARKLVDDNTVALARAHSARFEAAAKPLNLVHSYILFHLLSIRLQRDEALLQATLVRLARREAKVSNEITTFGTLSMRVKRRRMKLYPVLIKLLDGMTQSLERTRSLTVVEEDTTDLAEETDALLAYSKARRCLYLGETYAMLDKYPEALSLLQRGSLYVRQAQTLVDAVGTSKLTDADLPASLQPVEHASQQIPGLQKSLERAEARTSKDWHTFTLSPSDTQGGASAKSAPLGLAVENLSLQNAKAPGRRSTKPRKAGALFYDVAFSYIAPVATDLPVESVTDVSAESVMTVNMQANEQLEAIGDKQGKTSASSSEVQPAGRGLWGFFGRRK